MQYETKTKKFLYRKKKKEIHNMQYSTRQLAWTLQNTNIIKDKTR